MKNLCEIWRIEMPCSEKRMSKPETVVHPPHYNSLGVTCSECEHPIECIDVVRHLSFNIGNVIKYCWRADFKGSPIEDLKKAIFYLQDEIKNRQNKVG